MKKLLFIILALFTFAANADQWYQDTSGNLHFLSTQDIYNEGAKLLPNGVTPITPAQAASIQAALAASAAAAVASQPNPNGFAQAVKAGVGGILGANALMGIYPAFFPAIQSSAWADVQALILDAQAKNIIIAAQYAAIKAASVQYNIPLQLP